MEEDFLDIYEIRAKINDLEESLLFAYDNGDEDEIQSLKSQLEIVKEQEETLIKSRWKIKKEKRNEQSNEKSNVSSW